MAVSQDATSGKYVPANASEWTELLAGSGIPNPADLYLFQEASGNPADSIGAKALTASGTLSYQQTVTGWTRKSIRTTRSTAGRMLNTAYGNVNANSFTVLLTAMIDTDSVGVIRTIVRLGTTYDDDATLETNTTPRLQVGEGDGTRSAGTTDPTDAVHNFYLRVDDSANTVDGFLNTTKIVGGTQACNGAELCYGGDNVNTWFPGNTDHLYSAVWTSALTDAQISTLNGLLTTGPSAVTGTLNKTLGALTLASSVTTGIAATTAAGTTLAAMQAGSFVPQLVAAIEGYPYLLTDATPQQAIDAWSGDVADHYYTQARGGLFVNLENEQQLDPWNPFGRGGKCTLTVVGDEFGVDTHRRTAGAETELTATIDRDDATVRILATTGFAAPGEAYCGTECFGYTGVIAATSLTGCVRGKYIPFGRAVGAGFGEHHRYGLNELEAKIPAMVRAQPRSWIGKWVGVYLHKLVGGALNSKADAQLVFAGKLHQIGDDANSMGTVVELKHVLDVVAESTIGGRDQWKARIRNVIWLQAANGGIQAMRFRMKDYQQLPLASAVSRTANDLVVVASGASGANQINQGHYTAEELFAKLNLWWTSEKNAARLYGNYSIGFYKPDDGSIRSYVYWSHNVAAASNCWFDFGMPGSGGGDGADSVRARLGFKRDSGDSVGGAIVEYTTTPQKGGGGSHSHFADTEYLRAIHTGGAGSSSFLDEEDGTFVDQYAFLPSAFKPATSGGSEWGVFLLDNQIVVFGKKVGATIVDLAIAPEQYGYTGAFLNSNSFLASKASSPDFIPIRQIFALEMTFGAALKRMILSTGATGYNVALWDSLGFGLGLGIPHDIASGLVASIDALPQANSPIVVIIEKATKFADIFAGDMILRRAFLRWKNGGLEFATWKSPTEANTLAVLDESNKAAPAGTTDHHRSVTVENGGWARPTVKINYNRSINASSSDAAGGYRDSITLIDKTALDDAGGEGPMLTVNARNTFGQYQATGAGIEALAPGFLASMPLFSRPARTSSRSIDSRYFEGYSVGDVVSISDSFARDPDTGLRGVSTRYGIIIRHQYSLGGAVAGTDKPNPMGGTADLLFLDVNRLTAYVPCAQVDDTAATGGYVTATQTLTVYAHKHSEATEAVDASRFANGMFVRVIEIDPSDPAAPQSWDVSVTATPVGNTIIVHPDLTGWNSARKYRVIFGNYASVPATQQAYCYQADDADGLIGDVRAPYEYGIGGGDGSYTAWAATDPVELVPNASYGDAVGRDVGHEVALMRLVNNLIDYKTGHQAPVLATAVMTPNFAAAPVGSTHQLMMAYPIHLSAEILHNDVWRRLWVAPFMRSTDGLTASCRVSLCRNPPTDTDKFNVSRGGIYSEATFTRSSTTFATAAENALVCNMKGFNSIAWIVIECTSNCETWGLGKCAEGPRLY